MAIISLLNVFIEKSKTAPLNTVFRQYYNTLMNTVQISYQTSKTIRTKQKKLEKVNFMYFLERKFFSKF